MLSVELSLVPGCFSGAWNNAIQTQTASASCSVIPNSFLKVKGGCGLTLPEALQWVPPFICVFVGALSNGCDIWEAKSSFYEATPETPSVLLMPVLLTLISICHASTLPVFAISFQLGIPSLLI